MLIKLFLTAKSLAKMMVNAAEPFASMIKKPEPMFMTSVLIALTFMMFGDEPKPSEQVPRRNVLLLVGSSGSHQVERFSDILTEYARKAGFDIKVTKSVQDLSAKELSSFDVVAIYKDDGLLPAENEKGLLDFIRSGKGLVAIHCASHAFRNSSAYGKLVGGRFARHGNSNFPVFIIDAQHPAITGVSEFSLGDETYVHNQLTDDRQVLMVRDEEKQLEPMTWTRKEGSGRVFYTALGHDDRSWRHPEYQKLLLSGLRWAAGDLKDSAPSNPVVNGKPSPLAAGDSIKHFHLPAGFQVELFAAEPMIQKPICMTFDEKGRLFVAESTDYPNDILPLGQGHDLIKVLEDTNQDGKADKVTVFADKLNIPTSMLPYNNGLLVAAAPDILFLKDTDGDGKADERAVVLTGFNRFDTHAVHSNFRWGPDNWIWATIGYSGATIKVAGRTEKFSAGVFRFRPDGADLEFLSSTQSNTWGLGFDELGDAFLSKANEAHSLLLEVPNRAIESVKGMSHVGNRLIADHRTFHRISDDLRQVDFHDGYTAAAGQTILPKDFFPPTRAYKAAVVCEPTGHLVHLDRIDPMGSGYVARDGYNLLASTDPWFAPIEAILGPDGSLYVCDWYNYIVRHNPTPAGFKTGKGNAYITPDRDKTHGRIYRVFHQTTPAIKLDKDNKQTLLTGLEHPNPFWRDQAQRLIVTHSETDIVLDLCRLILKDPNSPTAISSLRALHGLNVVSDDQQEVMRTLWTVILDGGIAQRTAFDILPRTRPTADRIAKTDTLRDVFSPQAARQLLLALAEFEPHDGLGKMIADYLRRTRTLDEALVISTAIAACKHSSSFLEAILQESTIPTEASAQVVRIVSEHRGRQAKQPPLSKLLTQLKKTPTPLALAFLDGLVVGSQKGSAPTEEGLESLLADLAKNSSRELRSPIIKLARNWNLKGNLAQMFIEEQKVLLAQFESASTPEKDRLTVLTQLMSMTEDDETLGHLIDQVGPKTTPEIFSTMLAGMAPKSSAVIANKLTARWEQLSPSQRRESIALLLGRPNWTQSLLTGLEAGKINQAEFAVDVVSRLKNHPTKLIASRAQRLFNKVGTATTNRSAILEAKLPLAKKTGDADLGKTVFEKNCAKCHRLGSLGNVVGPDLTGIAIRPREEILTEILDPNRSVEGNYRQYTLATHDGRVLVGLLAAENKNSIDILDAEGKKQTVQREDIETLRGSTLSLMPEGFEKISDDELVALLSFLTKKGKFTPVPIAKSANAVSTRGMFYDKMNQGEWLELDSWGPREVQGVPFQLIDPAGDRVPNIIILQSTQGTISSAWPKSVSVLCQSNAKAIHLLSGVAGWGSPLGKQGEVSLIVRLHYADNTSEDHPLKNGQAVADYISKIDVPDSKFAFQFRGGQQMRYLSIVPRKAAVMKRIEFVKGTDDTAPMVLAVTIESP